MLIDNIRRTLELAADDFRAASRDVGALEVQMLQIPHGEAFDIEQERTRRKQGAMSMTGIPYDGPNGRVHCLRVFSFANDQRLERFQELARRVMPVVNQAFRATGVNREPLTSARDWLSLIFDAGLRPHAGFALRIDEELQSDEDFVRYTNGKANLYDLRFRATSLDVFLDAAELLRIVAVRPERTEGDEEFSKAGYLDLLVDQEKRTIRRRGHGAIVDLGTSVVGWHIFSVLFNAGESDVAEEILKSRYPGEWDGRRNAIKELRTALIPVGVTVQHRKWRLIEAERT